MKSRLLLSLFALLIATMAWADVEINETTFPDENFRNWVRGQSYGKDRKLTEAEIADVTSISVIGENIQSLKGIEFFTALKYLYCDVNKLTTLDVSQNTALIRMTCFNNKLTSLDMSQNTALTYLDCGGNKLTTLDLSQNTALALLYCYNNQLTSLDLSKNIALTYLRCDNNQLTTLDVSGCTALTTLYCYKNKLTTLDVSQNTSLISLHCYGNQLTGLDVSENTALTSLRCYQNQISGDAMDALVASLPTTSNGIMYVIYNENERNVMTYVQVDAAKAKGWIPYYYDSSQWQEYEGYEHYIKISEETFPDANFRAWIFYQEYSKDSLLSRTEIAGVTIIDVRRNRIQTLQGIEFFTALKVLDCVNNQLTELDVSQNTALTFLNCTKNQLTTLDVLQNTALTKLSCSNNPLTTLDVSQNTALTELSCSNNSLTTLDVSQNTALTYLMCSNNQLTTLDVSQNTALTTLYCYGNQLTTLDLSQNTALTDLYCYNNQLTTIDVSQNTELKYLYCYQNQISGDTMDALVESLPTTNYGIIRVIYNENEGNVMTYVQVDAAKAKGWIPYYYDNSQWQNYEGVDAYFEISEENFPDAIFRAWVLSQEYGTDGKLSRSEIAKVTSIDVYNKGIQTLQGIEFFIALKKLDCSGNQLTALDVSQNTVLTRLDCYDNQLTSLDVSQNTAMTYLDCSCNQFTTLDVSQNTALTYLDCSSNQLTALDVSQNTALTTLYCNTNLLTALDLSQNTALTKLYCYQNQISGDAMDAFVASLPTKSNGTMYVIYNLDEQNLMTYVQVDAAKAKGWTTYYYNSGQWQKYGGQDEYIEISEENFPDENFRSWVLKQEYGADGKLSGKEISGITRIAVGGKGIQSLQGIELFTALKVLICYNNQLTTLDVSQNTALTELECYNNQLTALDVSQNTALKKLHCYKNKLTELNLSENNTELTTLYCYQNEIVGTAMDAFVESLPTVSSGKMRVISDKDEQNVMTIAQVAAAKAKGWIPQYLVDGAWKEYSGSDPTGISSIDNGQLTMDNEAIYNLAGQRIADGNGQLKMDNGQLKSGIYIVNGKKILVK